MKKAETIIEGIIFNSRWLLAPFFIGLILSITLLLTKFVQELTHLVLHVTQMKESELVVGVLSLVDMTLVGCLMLMIIFSGYEIFVSKIDVSDNEDKPDWMGKVDFGGLKLKVISAIVAISAIELLKTFVGFEGDEGADESVLFWKVIIHTAFVMSGVVFALTELIASKKNGGNGH